MPPVRIARAVEPVDEDLIVEETRECLEKDKGIYSLFYVYRYTLNCTDQSFRNHVLQFFNVLGIFLNLILFPAKHSGRAV
jgi:hypothetical protein